jgi:dTDP-4-amino-4,6-dideoxygalactose transaminase
MVFLRKRNARILIDELEKVDELVLPELEKNHTFLKFVVRISKARKPGDNGGSRSPQLHKFVSALAAKGIETEWVYIPLHLRHPFAKYYRMPLRNTESVWWNAIALPNRPGLAEEEVKEVARAVKRTVKTL